MSTYLTRAGRDAYQPPPCIRCGRNTRTDVDWELVTVGGVPGTWVVAGLRCLWCEDDAVARALDHARHPVVAAAYVGANVTTPDGDVVGAVIHATTHPDGNTMLTLDLDAGAAERWLAIAPNQYSLSRSAT